MKTILPSLVAFALTLVVGVFFSWIPFEKPNLHEDCPIPLIVAWDADYFTLEEALALEGKKVKGKSESVFPKFPGRVIDIKSKSQDKFLVGIVWGDPMNWKKNSPHRGIRHLSKDQFRNHLEVVE